MDTQNSSQNTNRFLVQKKGYMILECGLCGKIWGIKPELYSDTVKHSTYQECNPPAVKENDRRGYNVTSASAKGKANIKWKHGRSNRAGSDEPTYRAWRHIKGRRCERWDDFFKFLEDMGDKPEWARTLRRKDKGRQYEPGNVYWRK